MSDLGAEVGSGLNHAYQSHARGHQASRVIMHTTCIFSELTEVVKALTS